MRCVGAICALSYLVLAKTQMQDAPTVPQRPFLPYLFPRTGKDMAVGDWTRLHRYELLRLLLMLTRDKLKELA